MAFSLKDFSSLEKIGKGGMGDVFSATQISAYRKVVIKKIGTELDQHPAQIKQFEQDANTVQQIQHDNIIRIYSHGCEAGSCYLVMEFVNGPNLEKLLQTSRFSTEIGLMVVHQALKGLLYAHRSGVAHRDIKPGNILVGRNGMVKLSDFGMAHAKAHFMQNERIRTVFATPLYMPPEQAAIIQKQDLESEVWAETNSLAAAELPPDQAQALKEKSFLWDIWSVGVLLYRICGNRMPFTGDTLSGLTHAIIHEKEKEISALSPKLPLYLAKVIHQCLEKDPTKRLSSLDPIIAALERYFEELQVADPETEISQYLGTLKEFGTRVRAPRGRTAGVRGSGHQKSGMSRLKVAVGAGLSLVFLAAVVGGLFFFGNKIGPQPEPPAYVPSVSAPVASAPVAPEVAAPAETSAAQPLDTSAPALSPESTVTIAETPDTMEPKPVLAAKGREQPAEVRKPKEKAPRTAKADKTATGVLKATVEPATASVYIDGKPVPGRTLLKGRQVSGGTHQIMAQANGYETFQMSVTVEPKTTHTISINLVPVEKGTGFLHVYSYPWAQVFVDYVLVGTSPTPTPIPLTEGEHTLQLRRDGFRKYEESVLVLKGQTTRIQVDLEKEQPDAAPATVPDSPPPSPPPAPADSLEEHGE